MKTHEVLPSGSYRDIFNISIPALAGLIISPLMSIIDTALVSNIGSSALAALSPAGAILGVLTGLMVFVSYGITPLVAKNFGEKNVKLSLNYANTGSGVALIVGTLTTIIALIFLPTILKIFTVTDAVFSELETYLSISIYGVVFVIFSMGLVGALRGFQDNKTPLIATATGALVNIILSAFFIFIVNMGIAGAALGTVIAEILICAILLSRLLYFNFHNKVTPVMKLSLIRPTLKFGGWIFIRTVFLWIVIFITAVSVAELSVAELASYQIFFTVYSFSAFALDSLAIAAQSLVAFISGSNKNNLVILLRRLFILSITLGFFICFILILFIPAISNLLSPDAQVAQISSKLLLIMSLSLPLGGLAWLLDGIFLGFLAGKQMAIATCISAIIYLLTLFIVNLLNIFPEDKIYVFVICYTLVFSLFRVSILLFMLRKINR